MRAGEPFNGVGRSFSRSSRWNPATVVNPENLARWCDHRFLAPRSVVAVRWSHSVPKRARHSRPRPLQKLGRLRRSGTRRLFDPYPHSRQSYHTDWRSWLFYQSRCHKFKTPSVSISSRRFCRYRRLERGNASNSFQRRGFDRRGGRTRRTFCSRAGRARVGRSSYSKKQANWVAGPRPMCVIGYIGISGARALQSWPCVPAAQGVRRTVHRAVSQSWTRVVDCRPSAVSASHGNRFARGFTTLLGG